MIYKFLIFLLLLIYPLNLFSNENKIFLGTTTSTNDSGLLKYLNKSFTKEYDIHIQVLVQGTGQALRTAIDGNIEVLMVHHRESELEFMKNGYGLIRHDLMYNDYVVVGPKFDNKTCFNLKEKLKEIYLKNYIFISRGDDSGTHKKELELWESIDIYPKKFNNSYLKIGQGMGSTLLIANEKFAYTLTDRATWISFKHKENLKIICESQPPLLNQYGIIIVNPKINQNLNISSAKKYVDWLISKKGRDLINNFKLNGEQLFFYNHN